MMIVIVTPQPIGVVWARTADDPEIVEVRRLGAAARLGRIAYTPEWDAVAHLFLQPGRYVRLLYAAEEKPDGAIIAHLTALVPVLDLPAWEWAEKVFDESDEPNVLISLGTVVRTRRKYAGDFDHEAHDHFAAILSGEARTLVDYLLEDVG